MQLTTRAVLLLLLITPLLMATAGRSWLQWLTPAYAGLALGLLLADWRLAGRGDRFHVARKHDARLSLGADNPIHIAVENRSRYDADVRVRDEAPDAFGVDTSILAATIAPRTTWTGVYHVRPVRRGDYRFGKVNLRWRGPLGLVVRQTACALEAPVKVYPNLLDIRRYDLLLRHNRLQEMGLRAVRRQGEGTEFERLREYLPDDDFRRINWKATARRNRPITTEYQTERSQTVLTAIDVGRMMQAPVRQMAKLDYVINATLLLTYVAVGKGDKVGALSFADDVQHFVRPRQGRGQFYRILELLYGVEAAPVEPDYQRAFSYLNSRQRTRALVVIFTDLSGGMTVQTLEANVALLARRSLPLVVTISDPEVVAAAAMHPTDSLATYQRAAAAELLDERRLVLDRLRQKGVSVLDVPANQLSIAVIDRYLELKAKTLL